MSVQRRSFIRGLRSRVTAVIAPLCVLLMISAGFSQTTGPSEQAESIRGTVLNSLTHEPIAGALVQSPDNRFATRTDNQGRFEFALPKGVSGPGPAPDEVLATQEVRSEGPTAGGEAFINNELGGQSVRPVTLSARKPGFLEDSNLSAIDLAQHARDITLLLVPEAVIAGHVSLPGNEASDRIHVQLFRRLVQNGSAQWVLAGSTVSKSNGDFRFADLPGGTYKLLTQELLDRDPLGAASRGQQYGYPPVYYPDASDFASGAEIVLPAGGTADPQLALVKQPYYSVKIAVASSQQALAPMRVTVSGQKGHAGPGYVLAYNDSSQKIEGLLPNGTYTIEAKSFVQASLSGVTTLVVKGAPVTDARIVLGPATNLVLNVTEEFTGTPPDMSYTFNNGRRSFKVRGPSRYLNVFLQSADEFNSGQGGVLQPPSGPNPVLQIEDVLPGSYWVHVQSSYGYVASARAGTTDLLREPLLVGQGSSSIPIEITMRDDSAEITGTVEGLAPDGAVPNHAMPPAFVYCVPTGDSTGQFAEMGVSADGTFKSPPLSPGQYRVLAFDGQQTGLEYRNPEAMKLYDGKGQVVQVAGGQTEHVTLQLSATRESVP